MKANPSTPLLTNTAHPHDSDLFSTEPNTTPVYTQILPATSRFGLNKTHGEGQAFYSMFGSCFTSGILSMLADNAIMSASSLATETQYKGMFISVLPIAVTMGVAIGLGMLTKNDDPSRAIAKVAGASTAVTLGGALLVGGVVLAANYKNIPTEAIWLTAICALVNAVISGVNAGAAIGAVRFYNHASMFSRRENGLQDRVEEIPANSRTYQA